VRIAGPLAVFADGFRGELECLGYSRSTVEEQLRLMAHLSGWLEDGGLEVGELTAARVEKYLVYRRACGRVHRFSSRALGPLLGLLRGLGVAPAAVPAPIVTASDRLLTQFEEYLLCDRALADSTVVGYRRVAVAFLASRFAGEDLRLEQPPDVGRRPQVRGRPAVTGAEHVDRWDLGRRVDRLQVGGKPARDAQPRRPIRGPGAGRQPRPGDRQLAGHRRRARGLKVGDQLRQDPPSALELEPELTAQPQIVSEWSSSALTMSLPATAAPVP
jgi:hypothetical protein